MEQLIVYLARALVDRPEQVSLKLSPGEGHQLYELRVAPEDIGKVIGRDGRTVSALRAVLNAAAMKQGQKVRLEVVDDRRTSQDAASPPPGPQGT